MINAPLVNITVPVFNETTRLQECLPRLLPYLARQERLAYEIVVADNGSTDGTFGVAGELARPHPTVRVVHLETKGRGRALKTAWGQTDADVLTYMDVDLSTDLECLPTLLEPLLSGAADLAIGSRRLPSSQTTRGWKREFLSRCYNRLLHAALGLRVADAQCGFKAITRRAAQALLPRVRDDGWFFDTELLVLAQREGWRVAEIPVRWVEDERSTVRLLPTVWRDLKGIWRLRGQLRGRNWPPAARLAAHHESTTFGTSKPPGA